ncbi:unnamed protein product [Effrenium voratum]|nr:unnamed protein product [Effrenium voratum]
MLAVRHPTLFELDKVIEACSTKRRQPVCIMTKRDSRVLEGLVELKSARFPRSRSQVDLAPGHYRMDVGLPVNKQIEVLASRLTRARSAPRFSFSKEKRVDKEDCLKGLSPTYQKQPNELGPGQYKMMKLSMGCSSLIKATAPSFSF